MRLYLAEGGGCPDTRSLAHGRRRSFINPHPLLAKWGFSTLSFDAEKLKGTEDISRLLFSRQDSRRAGRALVDWLKRKGGSCTQREMSEFSWRLENGELGFKFSRRNFYGGILRRYLAFGLIAEGFQYDPVKRKAMRGYHAVVQPITRHPPVSPSLPHLIHGVCQKWNAEFVSPIVTKAH
jgi:hypothetical protein